MRVIGTRTPLSHLHAYRQPLTLDEIPMPRPAPGEVIVKIATTRSLGKVFQIGLAGGTARLKALESARFEVAFECTLWGTIKELVEVVALVEDGRLALGDTETAPLDRINDVYARLKRGDVAGRIVVTP